MIDEFRRDVSISRATDFQGFIRCAVAFPWLSTTVVLVQCATVPEIIWSTGFSYYPGRGSMPFQWLANWGSHFVVTIRSNTSTVDCPVAKDNSIENDLIQEIYIYIDPLPQPLKKYKIYNSKKEHFYSLNLQFCVCVCVYQLILSLKLT